MIPEKKIINKKNIKIFVIGLVQVYDVGVEVARLQWNVGYNINETILTFNEYIIDLEKVNNRCWNLLLGVIKAKCLCF